MTKTEIDQLAEILAQMPVSDISRIKKLCKAELDQREPRDKTKRTVHPNMPWPEIMTRSGIHD